MSEVKETTEGQNINDIWTQCSVCNKQFKNCTDLSPCCKALSRVVENGVLTDKMYVMSSTGKGPMKPTVVDLRRITGRFIFGVSLGELSSQSLEKIREDHKSLLLELETLTSYTHTSEYRYLAESHKRLIDIQIPLMRSYLFCLKARIDLLEKEGS